MVRRRLTIHGRVQGVFFRDSLRRVAIGNDVRGWAINREDGAVEAVLEGDEGAVDAVIGFCHAGPERARVDRVEVQAEEPEGLSAFEIG